MKNVYQKNNGRFNITTGHILAIGSYIIWEVSVWILTKVAVPWWVFVIYYSIDIGYFYFISFIYLPYIEKRFKHDAYLFVFSLFILILYGFIVLQTGTYLTYIYNGKLNFDYSATLIARTFSRGLVFLVFAFGLWNVRHRISKIKAMKEAELLLVQSREREALMENALLRAQINPHLLFNSLNGIYVQLLKKAPEDAHTVLLLAEMMDYSLVNTNQNSTATIGEELQQLDRLITLNQFINNNSLHFRYDVAVLEEALNLGIVPLLFFNLIENIFKHGKLDDKLNPAMVRMEGNTEQITFKSSNLKSSGPQGTSRKIGLSNTRNRLQIHYPENHELSISETEDRFEVRLTINL